MAREHAALGAHAVHECAYHRLGDEVPPCGAGPDQPRLDGDGVGPAEGAGVGEGGRARLDRAFGGDDARPGAPAGEARHQGSPHFVAAQFKGYTSRHLRQEFPVLVRLIPSPWTRSYFIATVGQADADTVQAYIQAQRRRP